MKSLIKAFTLAEVLITLGIIGVIMALVIPQVIVNYQKQECVSKLEKFYSTMQSVIKASEADNGDMYNWNFPKESYDRNFPQFFRYYYLPYMKGAVECNRSNCFSYQNYTLKFINGNEAPGIYLASYFIKTIDGMYVYFLPNTPSGYIWMFVDINGHKKPNQVGRDVFVFDIYGFPSSLNRNNYKLKFWGAYESEMDNLTSLNTYGCNKQVTNYPGFKCGELILRSGWKIPDNYPW